MNTEKFDQNMAQFEAKLLEITVRMDRWEQTYMNRFQQPDSNSSEIPNSSDPNHYIPKVGEVVEVSDGGGWGRRVFIEYKNDAKTHHFKCLSAGAGDEDELKYRNGDTTYDASHWRYCRRLNGEIIEFGCDKKGVAESAESRPPAPILNHSESDYSHLLPEGYEFCEEEMAEQWIKVKNPTEANPLGHIWQLDERPLLAVIGEYRPIRKIQTASYQVDWSNAPDWADVHAWDEDRKGFWHGIEMRKTEWCNFRSLLSPFTLPAGLDWKLSKTYRPCR